MSLCSGLKWLYSEPVITTAPDASCSTSGTSGTSVDVVARRNLPRPLYGTAEDCVTAVAVELVGVDGLFDRSVVGLGAAGVLLAVVAFSGKGGVGVVALVEEIVLLVVGVVVGIVAEVVEGLVVGVVVGLVEGVVVGLVVGVMVLLVVVGVVLRRLELPTTTAPDSAPSKTSCPCEGSPAGVVVFRSLRTLRARPGGAWGAATVLSGTGRPESRPGPCEGRSVSGGSPGAWGGLEGVPGASATEHKIVCTL